MKPNESRCEQQAIHLEKVYPHSPQRVWQALTDPQALAQWLLPTTFKPRLGHRFRFTRRSPEGKPEKVRCRVVELEAPCRLAYTWQAEGEEVPTLVTWTLEPVEEGTCLRLEHSGAATASLNGKIQNAGIQVFRCSGVQVYRLPSTVYLDSDLTVCAEQGVCVRRAQKTGQVGRIVLNNPSRPSEQSVRCVSRRIRVSHPAGSTRLSRLKPIRSTRHEEVFPCTR